MCNSSECIVRRIILVLKDKAFSYLTTYTNMAFFLPFYSHSRNNKIFLSTRQKAIDSISLMSKIVHICHSFVCPFRLARQKSCKILMCLSHEIHKGAFKRQTDILTNDSTTCFPSGWEICKSIWVSACIPIVLPVVSVQWRAAQEQYRAALARQPIICSSCQLHPYIHTYYHLR